MTHPYTRSEILRGARDALPVMFAVAPYAMVLGAQASQVGLSLVEVGAMTGLNFAGGSEFAAIKLWAAVPPMLTIVLITLLINSRHIVMGAALAPYLQHLPKRKVIPALFFMADEGWAISYADTLRRSAAQQQTAFSWPYYWGVCLPFYPVWVGFALIGTAIGPALGNIEAYGFAMAFPAVFIVLLRGMWKGPRLACSWLISLLVAILFYLTVPGAWFVFAGVIAGMLFTYLRAMES